ncbi:hypothetical protein [Pseudomonas aeruginosa]|uniref:hypothetical protein n=1 Tax=Pseudomonas aeruginosa TaxID=287 RepID=UPI0008FB3D3D|nr:hypothetical protein [Pseudomonas aeruginosa]OPE34877.1 hypothetical protein APB46_32740 [Pseudomonas aeruginosa]HEH9517254.1 hypothetical protein [Pseudomonas aeruginosa]
MIPTKPNANTFREGIDGRNHLYQIQYAAAAFRIKPSAVESFVEALDTAQLELDAQGSVDGFYAIKRVLEAQFGAAGARLLIGYAMWTMASRPLPAPTSAAITYFYEDHVATIKATPGLGKRMVEQIKLGILAI